MDDGEEKTLEFVYSCDLDSQFKINLRSLDFLSLEKFFIRKFLEAPNNLFYQAFKPPFELFALVKLFSNDNPLCLSARSKSCFIGPGGVWNETISFPIKCNSLPRDACLAFTLYTMFTFGAYEPVGGATISLFKSSGKLREGRQCLELWEDQVADCSYPSLTPGLKKSSTLLSRLNKLLKQYEKGEMKRVYWLDVYTFKKIEKIKLAEEGQSFSMQIEFPWFELPVLYGETVSTTIPSPSTISDKIYDLEVQSENMFETKHRSLTRSSRQGHLGKDLKPNPSVRNILNATMRSPPTKALTSKEKDLLWRYRYFLAGEEKALTFFLKCVDWENQGEVLQAVKLLGKWAPIQVDDALELLSSTFTHPQVRSHAVASLESASDSNLLLFLLQLVQALKYDFPGDEGGSSNLCCFLIKRSLRSHVFAVSFYWCVHAQCRDKLTGKEGGEFAIRIYKNVRRTFLKALKKAPGTQSLLKDLCRQRKLISALKRLSLKLRDMRTSRPSKVEKLRKSLLRSSGLLNFKGCSLPLSPELTVTGIESETADILKSVMQPLCLTFLTIHGCKYRIIFKSGDDLRQDQLTIQLFKLMDELLRKEQLDLKLTPYRVLATDVDTGLVQFVETALPLASIFKSYGAIINFFQQFKGDPSAPYGVSPDVMETYIRSCAGYCVMTYLLGVGDRHPDNVLLKPSGHLFHIDFAYILGRDPKPFAPPLRLSQEMVDGMGGFGSLTYKKFLSYCFSAFLILRRSANLFLNLFSLMKDSTLPDILIEPDKVVSKVQERFRLDLSEEEAVHYLQCVISDSLSAFIPLVYDSVHKYLQYMRK